MQRWIELAVSVVGALVVLVLVALGVTRSRAALVGAPWWRRLLAGGMTLLGLLGFSAGETRAAEWVKNPYLATATSDPETAPGMQELIRIWEEAEAVASGGKGPYPFDQAGKDRLLADLTQAVRLVDGLVGKGLFQPPEGDLLKADLAQLTAGVQSMRPTEMRLATCYEPMMATPVKDSFDRLLLRLPHLEKLAAGQVSPLVLDKVLARMEGDLRTLASRRPDRPYDLVDEARAEDLARTVAGKLQDLRRRLDRQR